MEFPAIELPSAPSPPRKAQIPILAAVVPVLMGVTVWLITTSMLALAFAALGPLILIAGFFDGRRARRREAKREVREQEAEWERVAQELKLLQTKEREQAWRATPGALGCAQERPLFVADGIGAQTQVVMGSGERPSQLRLIGGNGERAKTFRRAAATNSGLPILVPLRNGICVRAPRPVRFAIARALVTQLALRFSPAQLTLVGDGVNDIGIGALPHLRSNAPWRLAIGERAGSVTDAILWLREPGDPAPTECATVLDCADPAAATLRTAVGTQELRAECLGLTQAEELAMAAARAHEDVPAVPERVMLADLASDSSGFAAVFARRAEGPFRVDIVEEGPHALVTGVTGAGKSELLVSWVAALAASRSPEEVSFVLADFKGGAAFEALRELPHVAAIVTDLDPEQARRGVESLSAELRRREGVLSEEGVRRVAESTLGRLVIVVDEFAVLVQDYPELGAVFSDIAARGRSLGMHLILGTQRATGVIRDSLAANCPLRISLRVVDAADSRLMLGTDAAATIRGGQDSRGLALVRRPHDPAPVEVRVALTEQEDIDRIVARWRDFPRAVSPWRPALGRHIPVPEGFAGGGAFPLFGVLDLPRTQEQEVIGIEEGDRGWVVLGGPGSGKSNVARLALGHSDAAELGPDPELAWDAIERFQGGETLPSIVVCDDLDQLAVALGHEHWAVASERLERMIRSGRVTMIVTASRPSGAISRILDAVPRRVVLPMRSRIEHSAAGAESATFSRNRPPGRGVIDGEEMQFFLAPAEGRPSRENRREYWTPTATTALVSRHTGAAVKRLSAAYPASNISAVGASELIPGHVYVGDAELWQRHWAQWQEIRHHGELLFSAECASELRTLGGVRELPPFAEAHQHRAWLLSGDAPARRVAFRGEAH